MSLSALHALSFVLALASPFQSADTEVSADGFLSGKGFLAKPEIRRSCFQVKRHVRALLFGCSPCVWKHH